MKFILWGFIFITISNGYSISGNRSLSEILERHKRDDATPEIIKVRYNNKDHVELIVLHKVTDTTLATFSVPIWEIEDYDTFLEQYTVEGSNPIFYHGINSFSALTYFPHTKTLHGVINSEFYIENFPVHNIEDLHIVNDYIHPIPDFKPLEQNPLCIRRSNEYDEIQRGNNGKRISDELSKQSPPQKKLKTNNHHRQILYPEIFLVVDVLSRIDPTAHHKYEKAVMYVLAYWNAVDMLFRQLKRTQIKINIAGIAIGKTVDVVNEVVEDASYYRILDDSHVYIINKNGLDELGKHLYEKELVKRDSYDFLIWMTSTTLIDSYGTHQGTSDLGIAALPAESGGLHDHERHDEKISNRAIVMHNNEYGGYQTAARELAHMMFVFNDDIEVLHGCRMSNCLPSNPLVDLSSGIMDPVNKRFEAGLMWSFCSEIHFENYANTKYSCGLLNYPTRTMGLQNSPHHLTVERQCNCYGMRAHDQEFYEDDICSDLLYCINNQGQSTEVATPLDGTPCEVDDDEGICNHNECVA